MLSLSHPNIAIYTDARMYRAHVSLQPVFPVERLASSRCVAISERGLAPELGLLGRMNRVIVSLELGWALEGLIGAESVAALVSAVFEDRTDVLVGAGVGIGVLGRLFGRCWVRG
jgi:hypothetical protein